jgi:hypothetical protein
VEYEELVGDNEEKGVDLVSNFSREIQEGRVECAGIWCIH